QTRLLSAFTSGKSDDLIAKAAILLDADLTVNEKLMKIDALIRIPATTSADSLGRMLGVSKTAVMKTAWWNTNRRGKKDEQISQRRRRIELISEHAKRNRQVGDEYR